MSTVKEMLELLEMGTKMGMKDEALQQFVKDEQARMRDEREKHRVERQEERDQEEKDRDFKLQMEKERAAREHDEREHARLIEEKRHQQKLEELELDHKLQLERSHMKPSVVTKEEKETSQVIKGPKLPPFEDSKDNIDAYIQRFEIYATTQKWNKDTWGTHLSALLKGKALDVFARLSPETALDFNELKNALLKRFDMTEDGFRKKFRFSKPDGSETFMQFSTRLDSYLERWIQLSKTNKTFDDLKDLFLREQFLLCCSKELALFLKERIPTSIQDMARYADQFAEARTVTSSSLTQKPLFDRRQQSDRQPPYKDSVQQNQSGNAVKCYECGRQGHKAFNCNFRKSPNNRPFNSSEKQETTPKHTYPSDFQRGSYNNGNHGYPGRGRGRQGAASVVEKYGNLPCVGDSVAFCETEMPVVKGCVGNKLVTVLRDTGCSGAVIRRELVNDDQLTGTSQRCKLADGRIIDSDVARIDVDTPYFTGSVDAWCFDSPSYDLILGNIRGVRKPHEPNPAWIHSVENIAAVETRAQLKKKQSPYKPLKVPEAIRDVSPEDILQEQRNDETLKKLWSLAESGQLKHFSDGGFSKMCERKQMLFREFCSPKVSSGKLFRQLIVPRKYRTIVMKIAHETLMGGHLGSKKTTDRVVSEFYWPGIQSDIRRFCRSCDVCQRTIPKGKVPAVPLGQMPLITEAFQRVAVDLIGPLQPVTDKGNRYILTLVDYATRYPEAIPLPGIETERVAEALVDIFSRLGVPIEMLTDQGSQFTSDVMKEVSRLLSFKRITTTPYHPMCNGLVEKFNGTLKQMLKRMCAERPRDWDKYINPLLFAYREVPQESLGFSPFDLLYGRTVRGPMTILKELWTKEIPDEDVKTTYQYVLDLRTRLEETCDIARQNLEKASKRQRKYYNRKTQGRQMKEGDTVLILLPTKSNKLLMQWKGPYSVIQKIGHMDYKIDMGGKLKTFHANLLKKYVERDTLNCGVLSTCAISLIDFSDLDDDEQQDSILMPPVTQTETAKDIKFADRLTPDQLETAKSLCDSFSDVFTDIPGMTNLVEHKIVVTSSEPVRVKPYPIPFSTEKTITEEVQKMLQLNVIEPSSSPYSAPVVIARKKDGTNRFCIDYRRLNCATVFDAEPMPSPESIFSKMTGKKFVSKIDLSKGYWQVPMADESKPLTAFSTPSGLYQFRTMPFGLVNAPATFSRMMRKLLQGMNGVENFIDDVIVFTDTFEEHLHILKTVFERLRDAGLAARPTKCFIGFDKIDCLGHMVGNKCLEPEQDKIDAVRNAPIPQTKKQVRAFLGLAGFYRKFIPNFSAIAIPLSDLTKKGQPNKVIWTESQQRAFDTLKHMLSERPILKLPEFNEIFILRTDAADDGIGAVLLQMEDDEKLPVAYASRKLQPREKAYAVIEKECLAVVWGIQKFHQYLYGREFLLETDHQPLTYLNKAKTENSRLMRWALQLQPYRFRIIAIKGSDNVGADYLSRQ
nr:uncharacterized protein LOC117686229 isoform X2 [Crassostrea gigas]